MGARRWVWPREPGNAVPSSLRSRSPNGVVVSIATVVGTQPGGPGINLDYRALYGGGSNHYSHRAGGPTMRIKSILFLISASLFFCRLPVLGQVTGAITGTVRD